MAGRIGRPCVIIGCVNGCAIASGWLGGVGLNCVVRICGMKVVLMLMLMLMLMFLPSKLPDALHHGELRELGGFGVRNMQANSFASGIDFLCTSG